MSLILAATAATLLAAAGDPPRRARPAAARSVAEKTVIPPPPPPLPPTTTTRIIDAWAGTGGCRTFARAERLTGTPAYGESDARLADFDRAWPPIWRERGGIKQIEFTPAELRRTVTGLACLATWPGSETVVPRAAVALFASKRWGEAAFQQLDGIARGGVVDPGLRAAARQFHATMKYEITRYGGV